MKRFFIFAVMLLAQITSAMNSQDEPLPVLPSSDRIILVPQDMFDIDRTIPYCCYTYYPVSGQIEIHCEGTGNATWIYIMRNGEPIDCTMIDSDLVQDAYLSIPQPSGTYHIILNSEKYYGEAMLRLE